MNTDGFEKRLESQPLRPVPAEWREDILSAARQAASVESAPRAARRPGWSPALLSTLNHQLFALLWPHPAAWAGLAAIWLVILGVNLATRDATPLMAKRAAPVSPQVFMAYQAQERLLAELLGPREAPIAQPPKPRPPQPRSEGRQALIG